VELLLVLRRAGHGCGSGGGGAGGGSGGGGGVGGVLEEEENQPGKLRSVNARCLERRARDGRR